MPVSENIFNINLTVTHWFIQHLLNTCSVPGTLLATGEQSSEQDKYSFYSTLRYNLIGNFAIKQLQKEISQQLR